MLLGLRERFRIQELGFGVWGWGFGVSEGVTRCFLSKFQPHVAPEVEAKTGACN